MIETAAEPPSPRRPSASSADEREKGLGTGLALAIAWLLVAHYMPDGLWRILPQAALDSLTLPLYGMLCQALTTGVFLAAVRVLHPSPRVFLGLERMRGRGAAIAVVLAPLVFVVATFIALKVAEPYLLEELRTQGPNVARKNAGAFGKAVIEAPLVTTLLWGAVLAATSEELMFRGALFGALRSLATRLWPAPPSSLTSHTAPPSASLTSHTALPSASLTSHTAPPSASLTDPRPAERALSWAPFAVATAVSALTFGAMHADMKGSVGIVRVVATTCLGFGCGLARWKSGALLAAVLLHLTYNTISVGVGRGWFASASEPLLAVVPNRLLGLALIGAVLAVGLEVARRRSLSRRGIAR